MSRIRKRDSTVLSRVIRKDYNPDGTLTFTGISATPGRFQSGDLKVIADTESTGYFALRKKGQASFNAVDIDEQHFKSHIVNSQVGPHPLWGLRTYEGSVAAESHVDIAAKLPSTWINDVNNAKGRALIEAYAKMNSPDVLFNVCFEEREKTLRLFIAPFESAVALLEKAITLKKRLLRLGYSSLKAFESAWLETRYGWRPTMYDIAGIATAIQRQRPIAGTKLVARAGLRKDWSKSETSDSGWGPAVRDWSIKTGINAGVMYAVNDTSITGFKESCLGLTPRNFPSNIWELIPFSFVVDWFVQIGPWLQASIPNPNLSILGNWVSVVDEVSEKTQVLPLDQFISTPPATHYSIFGGNTYEISRKHLVRDVNSPLGGPKIVETPLSFLNLLDGLFLLHGNILDKFRILRL